MMNKVSGFHFTITTDSGQSVSVVVDPVTGEFSTDASADLKFDFKDLIDSVSNCVADFYDDMMQDEYSEYDGFDDEPMYSCGAGFYE